MKRESNFKIADRYLDIALCTFKTALCNLEISVQTEERPRVGATVLVPPACGLSSVCTEISKLSNINDSVLKRSAQNAIPIETS